MAYTWDLQVDHLGVNCADEAEAADCARRFAALFGLERNPDRESSGSCYSGRRIEWMKGPGPGTKGHIALSTADLPGARAWLEARGVTFDDATAKYLPDGRMLVLYAREEIGGFAVHLLQRTNTQPEEETGCPVDPSPDGNGERKEKEGFSGLSRERTC